MNSCRISDLNPALTAFESKQFSASVILVWPYSSSQRRFALLLAEPDLRLRRNKGQVRARFTGSSARAIATTGVGIGDEVVLSLQGAKFVKEGSVQTPGKSIDWELEFTQSVVVQVFRNGNQIADLELLNVAPTPAPCSPSRWVSFRGPTPSQKWSSPAVLKRLRHSGTQFFEAPYDPFAEDAVQGHGKKRRRKSYRDHWQRWTYSARTPSPEEGTVNDDLEDIEDEQMSPIRGQQRLHTPVSPLNHGALIATADRSDGSEDEEEQPSAFVEKNLRVESEADDWASIHSERNIEYHKLYVGPHSLSAEKSRCVFGGGMEIDAGLNTEEKDVVQDQPQDQPQSVSMATTIANTEGHRDDQPHCTLSHVPGSGVAIPLDIAGMDKITDEVLSEMVRSKAKTEARTVTNSSEPQSHSAPAGDPSGISSITIRVETPPPTIPILQIEDAASAISDLLTPIGREPCSPALKPLDSATLPLPSPFPGDIESSMTSFQDYFAANQGSLSLENAVAEERPLPRDAEHIIETSFFSSIGSSQTPALPPNHESAFTPVRFTFGLDSTGFHKPLDLSSPTPDDAGVQETPQVDVKELVAQKGEKRVSIVAQASSSPHPYTVDDEPQTSSPQLHIIDDEAQPETISDGITLPVDVEEFEETNAIDLSSSFENDERNESESEDKTGRNPADVELQVADEEIKQEKDQPNDAGKKLMSIQDTGLESTIVDLGSPPSDDTQEADHQSSPSFIDVDETSIGGDIGMKKQPTPTLGKSRNIAFQPQQVTTHTPPQRVLEDLCTSNVQFPLLLSGTRLQSAVDQSDHYVHNAFMFDEASTYTDSLAQDEDFNYPNTKMESVENDSIFEQLTQLTGEDHDQTSTEPPDELLIAVPELGGKMGELHTVAVPATGPARNTRSKLSITVSPTRNQAHTPRNTRRSTRSEVSVTRETTSPVETRTGSTFSVSQGPSQVSPYSLRSQTKLLSPLKDSYESTGVLSRPISRRQAPKKDVNSLAEDGAPQIDGQPVDMCIFESTYDPSVSQGRFSNVPYVRDSEEDSVRSEHSLSTAYHTDGQIGLYSDPIQPNGLTEVIGRQKPPPASAPEPKAASWTTKATTCVLPQVLRSSSPTHLTSPLWTQSVSSSPSRRPSSAHSTAASAKTQDGQRAIPADHVDPLPEEMGSPDVSGGQGTPKTVQDPGDIMYSEGEGKGTQNQAVSQTQRRIDRDEHMGSSPPATITSVFPPLTHHSDVERHQMITPEDTQQSMAYSNTIFTSSHQKNGSLITPELTQATSTGHLSSPAGNTVEIDKISADFSSKASSDATESLPSIGLSTPLAYYTPLRDLSFFLNRSSQYYSTDNPDILALVTSDSTPPARAKKGPRHCFTTLHITDISCFPHTTTVNVFRPYETALPVAHKGDVILLRAFAVKSAKRQTGLLSTEDSGWCVWRWGKPCWGMKNGSFGELRAREEIRGPEVERGEGEWREVEKLREWYIAVVEEKLGDIVENKGGVEEADGSSQVAMGN